MSDREWYPTDWVDEMCPPSMSRPEDFVLVAGDGYQLPPSMSRPEDFVLVAGDGYQLGYDVANKAVLDDEREIFNQRLAIGDIINFMCCDRFDDVVVTVRRDGTHHVHGTIPPEHNWVTIFGDMDTLCDSFEEMLTAIFDPRHYLNSCVFDDPAKTEERATLMFARWSDSIPHQFSIDDGKPMFRQVAAAKTN